MFVTKKHLSRRTVLRGAGATIALPLLSAMVPGGAARAATPHSRFACIYIPHGAVMRQWTPADGPRLELAPILRSLEPFHDRLNVVSDLTLPLAYRSEEHTSELQSLYTISYAVFCLDRKSVV